MKLTPGNFYEVDFDAPMLREDIESIFTNFLNFREQLVLRLRFGLYDSKEKTLKEIGKMLSTDRRNPSGKLLPDIGPLCGDRIRQIEMRALHKLRHPKIGGKLKEYLYDEG